MNRASLFLFCLLSIIYIAAAATMTQPPPGEEDENNNKNKESLEETCSENSDNIEEEEEQKDQQEEDEQQEQGDDEDGENEEQQEEEQEGEEEDEEIKMFGESLMKIMELQDDDDDKIPFILEFMMSRIKEMEGFQTEGIFRVTGNLKDVEELANDGFDPYGEDIDKYEVHTWASLLKKWIRDLPEPLIPDDVYHQLMKLPLTTTTTESLDNSTQISIILKSIQPTVFYDVFERLCLFFAELLQPYNSEATKIDIDNLTTIMTPTVFKTKIEISKENLSKILDTQSKEKLLFKSILNYYIQQFKEENNEDDENDKEEEDEEEQQQEENGEEQE